MRAKRELLGLGGLEAQILDAVWRHEDATGKPATVRDIYEDLLRVRHIAYTTVMTVAVNLTKKGYLACDRSALAYTYGTIFERHEVGKQVLDTVLEQLLGGDVGIIHEFLEDLDTGTCGGCGREFVREALLYAGEDADLCPSCYASCLVGADEGGAS